MLTTHHSLNNTLATQLTNAACDYAAQQGLNICVWILDHAGHPLAFQRMPGAPLHSIQIAQDKAYTAVSFGFATHLWQQRLPHLNNRSRSTPNFSTEVPSSGKMARGDASLISCAGSVK